MSELKRHEFSTGYSVMLKSVSPLTLNRVRRESKPPRPPMNPVDYGDGKVVMEPNIADPEYIEAVEAYNTDMQYKMQRVAIKLSVRHTLTEEEQQELAVMRVVMAEEGITLEENDIEAFINNICIGSADDLTGFLEAVTGAIGPSREGVKSAQEDFKSPVPQT